MARAELKFPESGLTYNYRSVGIHPDDILDAQAHLAYYLFLDVPEIEDKNEIVETVLETLDTDFRQEYLVTEYGPLLAVAVGGIISTLPKDLDENDNNYVAWTLIDTYLRFIFYGEDLPEAGDDDFEDAEENQVYVKQD
jgi:hypothetical protein